MNQKGKIRVFYDGGCSFCVRSVHVLRLRDLNAKLQFISYEVPDFCKQFPEIEPQEKARSVQVQLADGTILKREQAVAAILEALPGWHWLALLIRFPLLRPFAALAYRIVAANRKIIFCCL